MTSGQNGDDPRLPDLVARWVEDVLTRRGWVFTNVMGRPDLAGRGVDLCIYLDVDVRGQRRAATGGLRIRSGEDLYEDKIVAILTADMAKIGGAPALTPPGSGSPAPPP